MSLQKISKEKYESISEGPINFWIPKPKKRSLLINSRKTVVPRKSDEVFYNKKQAFNREMSILVLKSWEELILPVETLFEPFCATGIRILRYLIQGPHIGTIICNDLNSDAVELTKYNINEYNEKITSNIVFYNEDIRKLCARLYKENTWFRVIDIDPFGSPQPFIHDAIRLLSNPGLLFVTATDMPVWVGKYPFKAYKRYGLTHFSFKNKSYCHEIALRAFISYIQREFMKQDQMVIPAVSTSIDHYLRVAFYKKRGSTQNIIQQTGFIVECQKCYLRTTIPLISKKSKEISLVCTCGSMVTEIIGPLWLGVLHQDEFLKKINENLKKSTKEDFSVIKRLQKYITAKIDENTIDSPWYYDLHWLSKQFKCSLPSTTFVVSLLKEAGFNASITHFSGTGIKTNAQIKKLKEVLLK